MESDDTKTQAPRMSADTVTAICAAVIAMLALFASAWQGYETRRHNQLSVMPHLDIFGPNIEFDDEYQQNFLGLVLDSAGLGPARIVEYSLLVDGDRFTEKDISSDKLLGRLPAKSKVWWLQPGDALVVGRRRFVFAIPSDSSDSNRQEFFQALQRVRVVIKYESFYGKDYRTVEWPASK